MLTQKEEKYFWSVQRKVFRDCWELAKLPHYSSSAGSNLYSISEEFISIQQNVAQYHQITAWNADFNFYKIFAQSPRKTCAKWSHVYDFMFMTPR